MVRKTTGLGRGLGALIPSEAATSSQAFRHIPIDQIVANPNQPRRHFDEEALDALAASIRMLGVLQPVLVRPSGDGYELIAGERRWRAARRAGLSDLPAVVREQDDGTALVEAVVENIQRQDLHALEEAAAYRQLLEDFDLTHEALAERVGRSRASITNTLRLLQLPTAVQRLVADRRLTAGHARAVLAVPDPAAQQELANRIVREDLSVRAAEEAARDHLAEDGTARVTTRRAPPVAPPPKAAALLELEERLAEQLSTNVEVTMTGKRGRIVIDFATVDDLERIYRALSVGFEPSIDG
jgi:ParB family transcriptional regulator, chromosome partitioning protein